MLQTGQRVGDFQVEAALGEDPLASTWQLRGPSGERCVLRLLQVRLPAFQERFRRSAEALSGVVHPNLVHIRALITHDGLPAVITDFVDGADLSAWIGGRAHPSHEVVPLFQGIVRGVAAAHSEGLYHRNLKPTKVLIGADGVPQINDFALGKATVIETDTAGAITEIGTTFGTPNYMSPEQFRGAAGVDGRADIFSLGAMLYEMLSGKRAFTGTEMILIYQAVVDGEFDPLPYNVPPTLLGLVMDLLDPDPDARPQTTAEVLARMREDPDVAAMMLPAEPSRMPAGHDASARGMPRLARPKVVTAENLRPVRTSPVHATPAPLDLRRVEEARSPHSGAVAVVQEEPERGDRLRFRLAVLFVMVVVLAVLVTGLGVAIFLAEGSLRALISRLVVPA